MLGRSTTMAMTTTLSTPPGTYPFTIIAHTHDLTQTSYAELNVLPGQITPTISPGISIYQGQSTTYTIMVQATPGLTQPATLAIDGLDDTLTTFWPNPVPLGHATTLAITTTLDTVPGTRPFTVTVSSHAITHTIQPALLVLPASITLSITPPSRTIYQDQSAVYAITVDATPGFDQPITLDVLGLGSLSPAVEYVLCSKYIR
jgi:hypothetical protein